MIIEEKPCSLEKVQWLYDYLMGTSVSESVKTMFRTFNIMVYSGKITSLKELGGCQTLWSNLGGFQRKTKYKVQESYEGLKRGRYFDERSMRNWLKVNEYIELLDKEDLEMVISAAKIHVGFAFIDGNKRTTAFHEYHRRKGREEIDFSFYLLEY